MIGAVFGSRGGRFAADFLTALAAAGGNSRVDTRLFLVDDGGLMAAPGCPAGQLAASAKAAWIGRQANGGGSLSQSLWARGDFASVAIGDEGELVLSRGHFGGRPLYYARDPESGVWIVASRLAPLVSLLPHVTPSPEALAACLLQYATRDPAQTQYREIARVPSGSVVILRVDRVSSQEIPFDVRPCRTGSVENIADELRNRITSAVTRAIAGADDVAVSVSGGVDSSAVLAIVSAIAKAAGGPRVHAVNLEYAGPGDDRLHLRALSKALGITPVHIKPRDCASMGPGDTVVDGAPVCGPGWAFALRVARLARERGASILLTGDGGDEIFLGDMRVFADRARRGHVWQALRSAATLQAYGLTSAFARMRELVARPLARGAIPRSVFRTLRAHRRRRLAKEWVGPKLRRMIPDVNLDWGYDECERGRPRDRSWLCYLAHAGFFTQFSESRAQTELVSGCTHIAPLLDYEVTEFVASLEPDLLFHGGWSRGLFRHAMRGLVPDSVRMRPDKAWFEPAFVELIDAMGGFGALRPFTRIVALADMGMVEPRAFQRRIDDLEKNPLDRPLWMEVWPVIALEAFVRQVEGAA